MKDEVYLKKLGKRIAELRQEKRITFREMAKLAQTSTSQLLRIEGGEISSSITSLRKIAKALDVSVSELIEF